MATKADGSYQTPERLLLPGSEQVLNWSFVLEEHGSVTDAELVQCTPDICEHALGVALDEGIPAAFYPRDPNALAKFGPYCPGAT